MRLILYSDLQADDGSERCHTAPLLPLQHYRVRLFYERLRQVYRDHGCGGVVDLGDTFDDRSNLSIPVLDLVLGEVALLPASKWNIRTAGNHDQFMRDQSLDNGRLFLPYFNVVSQPRILLDQNGTAWFLVPYPADYTALAGWLAEKCSKHRDRAKVLLGHFQVVGAQARAGVMLSGLPLQCLEPFELCLLGHVHRPQSLTERVHYVGSPFQQDWGEAGEAKRVAVLDTRTLELTWVPMEGFPEHRLVDVHRFQKMVQDGGEDRYEVLLRNPDEAQLLYAHPLGARAQPRYEYEAAAAVQTTADQSVWTLEALLERWAGGHPWTSEIDAADMIGIGLAIARGEA